MQPGFAVCYLPMGLSAYSASASSYTAFCLNGMYDKRCDDVTCTFHECNEPPNIHNALRKQLIAFLHDFEARACCWGLAMKRLMWFLLARWLVFAGLAMASFAATASYAASRQLEAPTATARTPEARPGKQSAFGALISGFDNRAEKARKLLRRDAGDLSIEHQNELDDMRALMAADRDRIDGLMARSTFDIRLLNAQIAALGPEPGEGAVEASAISARRERLDERLSRAMAPILELQERRARAALLVADIDARTSAIANSRRFDRGLSPLDPRTWARAAGEVRNAINVVRGRASIVDNPLLFVGLGLASILVLGVLSYWLGRKVWRAVVDRVMREIASSEGVIRHLALIMALDLIAAAVFVVALAISASLFVVTLVAIFKPDEVSLIVATLMVAATIVAGGQWLGRSIMASPFKQLRLLVLPQDSEKSAVATVRNLSIVLAAEFMLATLEVRGMLAVNVSRLLSSILVAGGAWLIWRMAAFLRLARDHDREQHQLAGTHGATINFSGTIARLMRFFAIVALVAAVVGYVFLARSILTSTLLSLALVCMAVYLHRSVSLVVNSLAEGALKQYRRLLHFLPLVAGFILVLMVLPVLAIIWGYNANQIGEGILLLKNGMQFGEVRISAGDVVTFFVVFFIGFFVTRWIQRFLSLAIIPELGIDSGAQASIVTFLGYVGITLAAFVAIATTGLDLSSLAFVAGALSVGLGFGLQSVVENFVSGILLLIERPVKVGDWVEVGQYSGIVRKIAVRSTHIETFDRHQIIVPNSQLITEVVKNRSFSVGPSRITVPVGVAYGTDLDRARDVLLEIAHANDKTLEYPEPAVAMDGFGDSAINLKILAFVAEATDGAPTASALNFEIARRFEDEGISIPFPQRDLHVRTLPAGYGT